MHYLEAHGQTAGPLQRPALTGAVTSLISAPAAIVVLYKLDALHQLAVATQLSYSTIFALYLLIFTIAGVVYGRIFQRAANDHCGGWLFGIAYGFLLWMIGPVAILQWAVLRPPLTGIPAVGLLGANLIYGTLLGILFPWIHLMLQRRFNKVVQRWSAFNAIHPPR